MRRILGMRRRDALSGGALVVAALLVVTAAFNSPGYTTPKFDLHDAGVWISSAKNAAIGRTNTKISQVDVRVRVGGSAFELYQADASVLVHQSGGTNDVLRQIDGRRAEPVGEGIALPGGSRVALVSQRGGAVGAVLSPAGDLWVGPTTTIAKLKVSGGEDDTKPTATVKGGSLLALGVDGVAHVYAPETGRIVGVGPDGQPASAHDVGPKRAGHDLRLAAVGADPVVLDATTHELLIPGRDPVDLETFGTTPELQQTGPARPGVFVATDTHLIDVPLAGGAPATIVDKGTALPAQPLVLGACVWAAWAGRPHFAQSCGGARAAVKPITGSPPGKALRFRTNRNKVLVNELESGAAFVIEAGEARPVDWDQAVTERLLDDGESSQSTQQQPDRDREEEQKDPVAMDDFYGTRPDRPIVVDVLENDVDPNNDLLVVESVSKVTGGGTVQIVGHGQQVQVSPAPGRLDAITFEYVAYDGFDGRDPAKVTVEVYGNDRNSPPRLKPQKTSVVAGATVTHDVLTGAVDPEGDPIALVVPVVLDTTKGTVTAEPGGVIAYTAPGEGFTGIVRVPFTVTDDRGAQQKGDLAVDVLEPGESRAPTARGDHATTTVGREVVIDVLANDTDADGDALRVVAVGVSPGATISVDANQKVHVVPTTPGVINVEYTITDGPNTGDAPLRVDVVERDTQEPPIAVRDDAVLRAGVPAIVDVLANDIDPNDDVLVVLTVAVASGVNLTVEVVDHRYLRVRTADGGLLAATAAFTYTISDGKGQAVGTVVVRPGPSTSLDQQPRAIDDDVSVRAGNVGAFDVLANDTDPEGERLAVSLPPEAELGDLADDVFAQGTLLRFVAPATPGTFTIPYAVSDPGGNRAAAVVNVNVLPATVPNNGPTPPELVARGVAGQPVVVPVPVATMDPDGDEVVILGVGDMPPSYGTVTDIGVERITYVPDKYQDGYFGTDVFTYRVRDTFGAEATGTVRVGVVPSATFNSPPVAIDDSRQVAPGGLLDIDPITNDSDPDGDALSLDAKAGIRLPSGVPWSARVDGDRIVFDGKGLAEGAEAAFGYTVTDGVLTDAGIVRVSAMAAMNAAPRAVDDRGEASVAGAAVAVDVLKNDSDPDGAADDLEVESVTGVAGATVSDDGHQIRFTMPASDAQLIYTVVDPQGGSARAVVRVPVATSERLRPTATTDMVETAQGQPTTVAVLDNDVVSPGTTKTLLAAEGGRGGTCAIAGSGVTFTATPDFVGLGGCSYVVGDGPGDDPLTLRSVGMLGVNVKRSGNTPPTFREQPLYVVADAETTVDLRPAAADPDPGDVDKLVFADIRGTNDVVSASFKGSVLTVAAAPDAVNGTVVRLTFSVSDGNGGVAEGAVTVTVSEFTGAPAVVVADTAETSQGVEVGPIKVLANDQRSAADEELRIVATSSVVGGTLTSVTESDITFKPDPTFFGATTFTYTVDDGTNQLKRRVTGTVTITVVGRPDRPPTPAVQRESGAITLDWGVPAANGAPITEYSIRASGGPVDEPVRKSSANSFRFDGLTNGDSYTFEIAAINAAVTAGIASGAIPDYEYGERSPGIVPNAIAPTPDAPTAVFVPTGNAITVTWSDPGGDGTPVEDYVLQTSPPPVGRPAEQTIAATANPMVVTVDGLANGTPYTFKVKAINDLSADGARDGVSEFSAASTPETPATRPDAPLKPTIVDKGDGQITVQWQAPAANGDPIRSFDIEVTRNGTVAGVTHVADPSVRQSTITTDNGEEFTFRVRAENKAGFSDYSPASDTAVSYGVPFGVTNLSADVDSNGIGSGQARVAFTAPDDNGSSISNYELRFATNGSATYSSWRSLGISNRMVNGLANGTRYVFQVRACNARGCATDAGNASNAVVPYGQPTTPSVSGGNNGGSIAWNWSPSDGNGRAVIRYELRIDGGSTFAVSGNQTSHTQGGYSNDGSTHTLYVVAVTDGADGARNRSGTGQGSVTRPPPPPPQVTLKSGSNASGQPGCSSAQCAYLVVTWSNFPSGSHSYSCHESDGSQFYARSVTPLPTGSSGSMELFCYADASAWGGVYAVVGGVRSATETW